MPEEKPETKPEEQDKEMYIHTPSLAELKANLAKFIASAMPKI
ncbi:MAG: hypothetical protein QMD04_05335 [Anaerolineales bacterium]|nr:hypothetical protein [Anaerolineales bacterium]